MKTYLLKCEKWYSTNMSIFSEGQKVGTLISGLFSSAYKVFLGEKEFEIRKKNAFSNNLLIYFQGELLASVQNFVFKNQSIISTVDHKEYVLKSNTWSNRYQLSGNEGFLGESHQKMISTLFSFDDRVDDLLITATIAQTHLNSERIIFIACFIPLFVAITAT
jgi:hypothetical protein